ncbi:hypothetical protein LINGRAHAP2_LOCUS14294 [Linum grandiflorum]
MFIVNAIMQQTTLLAVDTRCLLGFIHSLLPTIFRPIGIVMMHLVFLRT